MNYDPDGDVETEQPDDGPGDDSRFRVYAAVGVVVIVLVLAALAAAGASDEPELESVSSWSNGDGCQVHIVTNADGLASDQRVTVEIGDSEALLSPGAELYSDARPGENVSAYRIDYPDHEGDTGAAERLFDGHLNADCALVREGSA